MALLGLYATNPHAEREDYEFGTLMLWYSTVILLALTLFAIWYARELQTQKDSAHLSKVVYAAAIVGAIGTLCFLAAALI